MSAPANAAFSQLEELLAQLSGVVVAYSGGMDSGFLALTARRVLKDRMKAVFIQSAFIAEADGKRARELAARFDFPLTVLSADVLSNQELCHNPDDRCYICKKMVISQILAEVPAEWSLVEGSVTDDAGDYRPGKKALREAGILSPLEEAGFSKTLVAEGLRFFGASDFIRPSQSCLATRVPAGQILTAERLKRIDEGESFLAGLGLSGFRLRDHDGFARIECAPEQWPILIEHRAELHTVLCNLGFSHITLDLGGYRRGSTNRNQT